MKKALAYRVDHQYSVYGDTGLYVVQFQSTKSYNWVNCAWETDYDKAKWICKALANIDGVSAYDIGGYEMK